MYVRLGTPCALTGFSVVIDVSGFYELYPRYYTGQVDGLWGADGGSGMVTELS